MGGELASEKEERQTPQSVTSVGSSWIICRSKSHTGRIYYFNTFTGEAAWNLSDHEMEKAKNRTKILQSQTGAEIEGCPEPKDPPIDIKEIPQSSKQYCRPRVYNKQIINNQFSKQTFTPFVTHCTMCNSHIPRTNMDTIEMSAPVPHNCTPSVPIPHNCTPSVSVPHNCTPNVPVSHNCTPNVWAVPPNHQIGIAPPTPVITQPQIKLNIGYNDLDQHVHVQNTSLSLSRRFNMMQGTRPNRNIQQKLHFKKFNNKSNDLRDKLSARRFKWNSKSSEGPDYQVRENSIGSINRTSKIKIIKPTMETITQWDADDNWLKENASAQGNQLFLDVTPLKEMVATHNDTDCWYVVADIHVLLNNIYLIKAIVNSDQQCQLMVPEYVMRELQDTSGQYNTQLMSRAHNVLQILSQLFAADLAVLGTDDSKKQHTNYLYEFCTKLSEQDLAVVIISNNNQMETYRRTSDIPILTVPELKSLLARKDSPDLGRKLLFSLNDIKITVPNDNNLDTTNLAPNLVRLPENSQIGGNASHITNMHTRTVLDDMEKEINKDTKLSISPLSPKNTVDVGVQTDIAIKFLTDTCTQKIDKSTITEYFGTDFENISENEITKRKGIQLKRNLSHQPVIENNLEKKQFKWRRKKRAESALNNISDDHAKQDKTSDSSTGPDSKSNPVDNTTNEMLHIEDRDNDEPNDSSETGSSCYIHKTVPDKIVIEETSTSGIISNSASNVDSDIMYSLKSNEQIYYKNITEEKDNCKCAMFEIESPAMEESLKMRCDEWISRFVQIMEEVLTQILQRDPAFVNRTLPPPWTIHEATECVKKKFSNDSDVVDAANKLTGLLFKVSDGRGKIKVELKPTEFMEMYSYGVYLVDSLQTILSSCDDLQTAADSLAKLLNDIVDPGGDTSHVDVFMDTSHVSNANITEPNIGDPRNDSNCDSDVTPDEDGRLKSQNSLSMHCSPTSRSTPRKYNLRSSQKKVKDCEETEVPVKFIRNIDIESSFFASLNLLKNKEQTNNQEPSVIVKNTKSSPEKPERPRPNSGQNSPHDTSITEPKIIRNFSKCLEFEEKIKNKQSMSVPLHESNPSVDLEEGEIDEYEYNDGNFDYDYDEDYSYDYDSKEYEAYNETDPKNTGDGIPLEQPKNLYENGNKICHGIFRKVIKEIQEALLEVHSFCDKTNNEICSVNNLSIPRKFEIRDKAEKARLHVDTLRNSLNSIVIRESASSEKSLQAILKEAGIHVDVAKIEEYRNLISKYSEQTNILLEAVDIIIEAVNE